MKSKDLFESKSGYWEKWSKQLINQRKSLHEKLIFLSNSKPNDRILDFACGIGEPSLTFSEKLPECSVYAVDSSNEMLKICEKRRLHKKLKNLTIHHESVLPFRFSDSFFDCIVIVFGMEYIDAKVYLNEFERILKKDGKIIIVTWGEISKNVIHSILREPLASISNAPDINIFPLFKYQNLFSLINIMEKKFVLQLSQEYEDKFSWESVEEFYQMKKEVSPPISDFLQNLDAETECFLLEKLKVVSKPYFENGFLKTPYSVNITIWKRS
jgi:ubiquinone/menaquinone biosynthesis C-methylase UbiE